MASLYLKIKRQNGERTTIVSLENIESFTFDETKKEITIITKSGKEYVVVYPVWLKTNLGNSYNKFVDYFTGNSYLNNIKEWTIDGRYIEFWEK
jgi:hypothetical protein